MLTNEEKQELRRYEAKLVENSVKVSKGHLTLEEQEKITILLLQGYSIRTTAEIIGRNPSTLSRELNRKNVVKYRGQYMGLQTHINVQQQWHKTHKGKKLDNIATRRIVEIRLENDLSPETIAGRLRNKYGISIHHETIYQYIYKENRV